jgi:lipopolysaccharide exporter
LNFVRSVYTAFFSFFPNPGDLVAEGSPQYAQLTNGALRGVKWGLLSRGFAEAGKLARLLILARLLAPDEFGVAAIAVFVIGCVEVFTEPGVNAALIRSKTCVDEVLHSAFSLQLFRGVAMCLLVQAATPSIASYFHEPRCVAAIRVVSVWLIARGLASPGMAVLAKELSFRRVFSASLFETFANVVGAIVFGLVFRNAVGIALAFVVTEFAKSGISYRLHPYRPKLSFSWQLWREYANFGRWVLVANVSIFLAHALDGAIVGKVLGSSALGFYAVAVRAADLIRINLADTVAQIYYSVFSQLQDRVETLRALFGKLCSGTSIVSVLVGTLTVLGVYGTIHLVIGDKWQPAFLPTVGLVAAAVLRPIPALATKLFYAIGRPGFGVLVNMTSLVIVAPTCWLLTARFGLHGAVASVFLSSLGAAACSWFLARTVLKPSVNAERRSAVARA